MKNLFRDKRANAWINVMVILVLATCLAAGYTFLTSSNEIEAEISGVSVLNDVHIEENEFNFYVTEAGEKAIEETYKKLKLPEKELHTENSFFSNFEEQFKIYGLEGYLIRKNFVYDEANKKIDLKIDNWQVRKNFKTEKNDLEVLYRKDLNFKFALK